MSGHSFQPHVPHTERIREFSLRAVLLGLLLGVIFAIGNAYLGLKVGMTVSASIPAAVISMAVLRAFSKNVTILENNIVQTIASAGESTAAGVIFTIPALVILGEPLSVLNVFLISLLGGLLGVLLMIPLRHTLMVEEHDNLPYPEGTACAEILKAREGSSKRAMLAVWGLLIGVADKALIGIFRLYNESISWTVAKTRISIDTTPALLGVGFIIGIKYSLILFAGGVIAWWVIIPIIYDLGTSTITALPATEIWQEYVRPMGTGAVAVAGFISLVKLLPVLYRSLKGHFSTFLHEILVKPEKKRTDHDLPIFYMLLGTIVVLAAIYFIPIMDINVLSLVLIGVLGFFFVALTSVTVGIIGNSSNPVSGMVICTLLITTLIFLGLDWTSRAYLVMAMTVGAIVAVAIGMAGDTSQDLKTGFLVGATPHKQQIGALIGVILPALVLGYTLLLLQKTFGLGSPTLPAPQATMMATVVKGVITQNLPIQLVTVGAILALSVELLGVTSLPFALGLYLPFSTSTAIAVGGLLSRILKHPSRGTLLGSGLIAGDALTGILIAGLAILKVVNPDAIPAMGNAASLVAYAILVGAFAFLVSRGGGSTSRQR